MVGAPKSQMQRLSRLSLFSRWEVAELPKLLMPGEHVIAVLSGFYTSGTAILCVTSRRLLLIDKKFVRLNYEDMRFEAISDISFSQQAFLASARFYIAGRSIQFRSWYKKELRILVQFVQDRMFEAHENHPKESQAPTYSHHFMNRRSPSQILQRTTAQEQEDFSSTDTNNSTSEHMPLERPIEIPHHILNRVKRWQRAAKLVSELS